jgi:hypothetical protein
MSYEALRDNGSLKRNNHTTLILIEEHINGGTHKQMAGLPKVILQPHNIYAQDTIFLFFFFLILFYVYKYTKQEIFYFMYIYLFIPK